MAWASKVVKTYIVTEAIATGNFDLTGEATFGFSTMRIEVEAELMQGTNPTLDVTIEDTLDDLTWNVIGTVARFTEAGTKVINIHPGNTGAGFSPLIGPRVRCVYTIGGADGVEPDPPLAISFRLHVWAR